MFCEGMSRQPHQSFILRASYFIDKTENLCNKYEALSWVPSQMSLQDNDLYNLLQKERKEEIVLV